MKEIPLTKGQVALVDDEDYERVSSRKWCAHYNPNTRSFYATRRVYVGNYKTQEISMHRQLLNAGPGQQVDHVNLNSLDNRRRNIRLCTPQQNACNRRHRRNAAIPYKGIFENGAGRFTARIVIDGRRRSVGTFPSAEAAAEAYDVAARQHYGEFARLNVSAEGEV
jgi:hypothetical protein